MVPYAGFITEFMNNNPNNKKSDFTKEIQSLPIILDQLASKFCERRDYYCLYRFLPALFATNGMRDGWELCRKALADTRALCREKLKQDEVEIIHTAMNIIDRMLG